MFIQSHFNVKLDSVKGLEKTARYFGKKYL